MVTALAMVPPRLVRSLMLRACGWAARVGGDQVTADGLLVMA
jgi:hypothetical protein